MPMFLDTVLTVFGTHEQARNTPATLWCKGIKQRAKINSVLNTDHGGLSDRKNVLKIPSLRGIRYLWDWKPLRLGPL